VAATAASSSITGSGATAGSTNSIDLRPARPWRPEDWQAHYDERAAIAEFDGGLCRPEAEERAFNCCVAEWLGRNPVYSSSDRCLLCAEADRPNDSLLPVVLAGAGQAWLHCDCVPAWRSARMGAAVEALMAMNIKEGPASAGIDITGSTARAETAAASPHHRHRGSRLRLRCRLRPRRHPPTDPRGQAVDRRLASLSINRFVSLRVTAGEASSRGARLRRRRGQWMLRNP
jgi:hypothetical protein